MKFRQIVQQGVALIKYSSFKQNIEKMENKEFQFKTNINCGGCIETVQPHLDNAEGICHWGVDTTTKDKILSVHSEGISAEEVIQRVQEAGFNIELLNQ